jgi:hypothetical protein
MSVAKRLVLFLKPQSHGLFENSSFTSELLLVAQYVSPGFRGSDAVSRSNKKKDFILV